MKRFLLTIMALLVALSAFSQTSSGTWNSRTATYTNTTHNLTWKLIDDWTWNGRPILAEGTLFKVRNDDTHILCSLSVNKEDAVVDDIWNHVSDFESPAIVNLKKMTAKQNGMTFNGTKASKSQLCGIHAVKTRTDMKKYYPEHKATVHGVEIMYNLYKRGNLYTVTVTALSVLEEEIPDFDRIATELFNGFSIR